MMLDVPVLAMNGFTVFSMRRRKISAQDELPGKNFPPELDIRIKRRRKRDQ